MLRLATLALIPVLLLGLAELALRLSGYGYSTAFFKKASIGGQEKLVDNDQFGLSFFPAALARIPAPVVMEAVKPARSFRIFILGESAALGDPRPNYSAARYMESLLRERFPGRDFEVVNTSMTGIDSHVILPIARECAGRLGDCWIIYMGNNEMVGPFGGASVYGSRAPPWWLVRASLAVQKLRLGQSLMACERKLVGRAKSPAYWKGMEMFLNQSVPPRDPRRATVYNNFRRNLEDIVRAGLQSGAKIVLNTMAVNLKDCPPFGSDSSSNLANNLTPAPDQARTEAIAALARGDLARARKLFEQALGQHPDSAELQFRLGDCRLRLGDIPAAQRHFQAAVDLDTLPFRADSPINDAIRSVAGRFSGPRLALCDAPAAVGADTPSHIPGRESFYEHVHLNPDGNFLLGLAWAREVEKLLPDQVRLSAAKDWASPGRVREVSRADRLEQTFHHSRGHRAPRPSPAEPPVQQRFPFGGAPDPVSRTGAADGEPRHGGAGARQLPRVTETFAE